MNEKLDEIRLLEEYIADLQNKEKFDGIKVVDYSNGSWTFKPRDVVEAYYTRTKKDTLIHVEDDRKVADFPVSDIKTIIRFKKNDSDFLNDTMKIINKEKDYKSVILYNSLGQEWEFDKIVSIEEDHDINPELIIITYIVYEMDKGSPKKQKKKLYLYDNNITSVLFIK